MRVPKTTDGLKVHAVAGTYVVTLGFNLPEQDCPGLLGFSIHRVDHTETEAYYLEGMKAFAETDPGFPAGAQYSTKDHRWTISSSSRKRRGADACLAGGQ
jgi:hypothetical protein